MKMVKSMTILQRFLNSKKLLHDLKGNQSFNVWSSSLLIEADGSPGKDCLVYVGLLAVHLFNVIFIYLGDGLPAAVE
jgi:hypothetical protein